MIGAALSVPELEREPYEPRGIFNSEMALVIGLCRRHEIEVVIESGRARGQSTYLLAKYLPRVKIVSVDRVRDADAVRSEERLANFPDVFLPYGDGCEVAPRLIRRERLNGVKRIAVLLDGPKGYRAVDLLADLQDSIELGFAHDMRRLDHGQPSPYRQAMLDAFPSAFFTDDEAYVEATKHLDAPVWAIGEASGFRGPYDCIKEDLGSYGPTLGVFVA